MSDSVLIFGTDSHALAASQICESLLIPSKVYILEGLDLIEGAISPRTLPGIPVPEVQVSLKQLGSIQAAERKAGFMVKREMFSQGFSDLDSEKVLAQSVKFETLDYEDFVNSLEQSQKKKSFTINLVRNKQDLCESADCIFKDRTFYLGDFAKPSDAEENSITISGMKDDWWYRSFNVGGSARCEFSDIHPEPRGLTRIVHTMFNGCTCYRRDDFEVRGRTFSETGSNMLTILRQNGFLS